MYVGGLRDGCSVGGVVAVERMQMALVEIR